MPGTIRLGALLALLAAVVALPGCGSDEISGEIPAANAGALNAALDDVSAAVASQNCVGAADAADGFVAEVNKLPADPTGELKPELQNAGDHLRTLVETECPATDAPRTTQDTDPTTTEDTTTTTEDTTTTTTEDTTTTDDTTTTGDTTTDETQPPGNGGGGGPPGDGGTGGTGSGEDGA